MRSLSRSLVPLFALLTLAATEAAAQAPPGLRVYEDRPRGEMVLEVGPVDLPAGSGHHQLAPLEAAIPVAGWLRGFSIEMVDGAGRPVPQQTLHHVNVILPERRELFSQIMLRLAAAGQETAPARLPRLFGYRARAGERVLVTAMLHNPTDAAYDDAYLRVRMPLTRSGAFVEPVSIYPFYLDVMPPASLHSYDLPPGRSEKSWEGEPAVDGRILAVGGHLHRYGVALRLEDVTAGKTIWEGRPEVDSAGEVTGMPTKKFIWRLGYPVRAGRTYRVTAVYDNPTGATIPDGAMGALGGVFAPSGDRPWPAANPEDPEYRLDVHLVHTGNQEMKGQPGGHGAHGGHGGEHAGHGGHGDPAAPASPAPSAGHAHGMPPSPPAASPAPP
ncbi:MAG TPA: hypothetical protein VHG35_04350, partial [Gemmatimonadales bacterium]|nr:hypothetical protein [Gemmatimonadales bacterium]